MLIAGDQHEHIVKSTTHSLKHSTCQFPTIASDYKAYNKNKVIPPLLPYTTYATPDEPPPQIIFPISADHCLITLVQYNVIRAMIFNMAILSLLGHLPHGCTSTFNVPSLGVVPARSIPPDLQYTPLQQSRPHPYWISVIPVPRLRDNLILSAGKYDEHEFCYDLGLGLYEGFDDIERRGLLVWGQAWRGHGWEVSEGFFRKWGFLLGGCSELIESTNCWRELRGDNRLVDAAMTVERRESAESGVRIIP